MILFRLENRKGEGVYSRGFGYKCTAEAIAKGEISSENHPGPSEDPLLKVWWNGEKLSKPGLYAWEHRDRKDWYCAFESLDALYAWFPKAGLELLKEMADRHNDTMAMAVYEVKGNKVKKGETQVVFHMPSARFVEWVELDELIRSARA